MFCGKKSSSGGSKDADCSSFDASASIAELLLAGQTLLRLLLLQQSLENIAGWARRLKYFQHTLEFGFKGGRDMLACKVFASLLAYLAFFDKLLFGPARRATTDHQTPSKLRLCAKSSQSASHYVFLAVSRINRPAGMSSDTLVAGYAQRSRLFDDQGGHDGGQNQ